MGQCFEVDKTGQLGREMGEERSAFSGVPREGLLGEQYWGWTLGNEKVPVIWGSEARTFCTKGIETAKSQRQKWAFTHWKNWNVELLKELTTGTKRIGTVVILRAEFINRVSCMAASQGLKTKNPDIWRHNMQCWESSRRSGAQGSPGEAETWTRT